MGMRKPSDNITRLIHSEFCQKLFKIPFRVQTLTFLHARTHTHIYTNLKSIIYKCIRFAPCYPSSTKPNP